MRLLTYQYRGEEAVGVLGEEMDLVVPITALGLTYDSMNTLILHATEEDMTRLRKGAKAPPSGSIPYEAVEKMAPIPRPLQDVICVGLNYMDHVAESTRFKGIDHQRPAYPVYFSKRVSEAVGTEGEIQGHLELDEQLDYEVELAVIIGKDMKKVPAHRAKDYIFGYTILNDVSARVLQGRHKQFYFGKSLDGFTPIGPWIVTPDALSFPLTLQSFVNGELRQETTTERMLFPIPDILAELSAGMTLRAGSILSTGTPAGVGMGFDPPRFLKAGDTIACVIEGIGSLVNTVV